MSGHGHVTPNPDGSKAHCGGPALCGVCAGEWFARHAAYPYCVETDEPVTVPRRALTLILDVIEGENDGDLLDEMETRAYLALRQALRP